MSNVNNNDVYRKARDGVYFKYLLYTRYNETRDEAEVIKRRVIKRPVAARVSIRGTFGVTPKSATYVRTIDYRPTTNWRIVVDR